MRPRFQSERHRWDRRRDLGGAELTHGVFFSLYAKVVRDDDGSVVGSEGFYSDVLLSVAEGLNMTILTAGIPSDPNWRRLDNGSWYYGFISIESDLKSDSGPISSTLTGYR